MNLWQTIFGKRKEVQAPAEQIGRDVKAKRLQVERASNRLERTIEELLKERDAMNGRPRDAPKK